MSVGIACSTVCDYLHRAAAAGLSWPLPESMTEAEVDRLLFPRAPLIGAVPRPQPDWAVVHQELRRKGMTLLLLLLDAAPGLKYRPGFMFTGFQLEGTANATIELLFGDNAAADADLLDAVTVENPSTNPVQVTIVEPLELTASSVTLTANGATVADANPLPVEEQLPTAITNVAPVNATAVIAALLAASAARRGFYARNAGADAVALVGAAGTFAKYCYRVAAGRNVG